MSQHFQISNLQEYVGLELSWEIWAGDICVEVIRMVQSSADDHEIDVSTQGKHVEWHQHAMGRLDKEARGKPEQVKRIVSEGERGLDK